MHRTKVYVEVRNLALVLFVILRVWSNFDSKIKFLPDTPLSELLTFKAVSIDLNDDGMINILDVVLLVNIVLGIEDFNPAGDLNSDGNINVLDVVILVNMILGG